MKSPGPREANEGNEPIALSDDPIAAPATTD